MKPLSLLVIVGLSIASFFSASAYAYVSNPTGYVYQPYQYRSSGNINSNNNNVIINNNGNRNRGNHSSYNSRYNRAFPSYGPSAHGFSGNTSSANYGNHLRSGGNRGR